MRGEEMTCDDVRSGFADYLAGSLDDARARALEQHVSSCAACQAEYADVEALWRALGSIPTPLVPSTRMRERFSAMVAAERASTERRPASRRVRGRTWTAAAWTRGPLAQLGIAASLLIGGFVIGRETMPRPAPAATGEIAEVRSELRDMRQMLTLTLMQQQSATERLRGVSWTAQIEQPGSEVVSALLDTLLHDPNVNVRLAAIDALRRFSDRPEVRLGTKQAATDPSSPLLQVAVIDFMVETRDPQAPALLRTLAADTSLDELVRGRAQWGLEQLQS
jgi:hypothetical protein